ncbi:transporter substrate-binding domain-containing protein [Actinomadura xylanilytica]|uniref:transporter substrate-binding domain-containing protein n=1 Tax=Actinomadura xylanilytica TaxID=887459 RepID=UPI00255B01C3|nr:transporter substrate-binding domain-containing protein [Actinomadura xylanilytica]MDL4775197.1 transporter substrate-binding domain-containing protein [Actinomadura xylanilytica]
MTRRYLVALTLTALVLAACDSGTDGGKAVQSAAGSPAASSAQPWLSGVVHVGAKNGQPGFNETSKDGHKFDGFENDLATYLGRSLKFDPLLEDITTTQREPRLVSGADRLVIATYSMEDERRKRVDFVGPYLMTRTGVLIREDDRKLIRTSPQLKKRKVCTVKGSTSEVKVDGKGNPDAKMAAQLNEKATYLPPEEDYKACVNLLIGKNADAVWTDQAILYGFANKYKDLRVIKGIVALSPQYYGIGIAKGHYNDCIRLKEALKDYLMSTWSNNFATHFHNVQEVKEYKPEITDVDEHTQCTK